ncbi:MAG: sigma-70 family RNA polymerase sigma factor [Verrucomicrobia bacterium]|jgi:RNA polymerase sigma-70 factor, ECF subfamily|nr:sigma-70 family RNA polymerase sigma factor [Verrucomicrobiota bacterium]
MSGKPDVLLEQAKNGDVDAFAELFENLRPSVHAVACRLVGTADADDVVMDTYLKAWKALPRFGERASLKTWLYRITRNCGLDLIRSRSRRPAFVLQGNDERENPLENLPDETQRLPGEDLERDELVDCVKAAMSRLPPKHRLALQLRFTDDLSYGEMAAVMGVSIGTVMSRLFNGKRKLRKILEEAE